MTNRYSRKIDAEIIRQLTVGTLDHAGHVAKSDSWNMLIGVDQEMIVSGEQTAAFFLLDDLLEDSRSDRRAVIRGSSAAQFVH